MSSPFKSFDVFENNPFADGLFDFMESPEGILVERIRELTWEMLESVTVDTTS